VDCPDNGEEVGMTSSPHGFMSRATNVLQCRAQTVANREGELSEKKLCSRSDAVCNSTA